MQDRAGGDWLLGQLVREWRIGWRLYRRRRRLRQWHAFAAFALLTMAWLGLSLLQNYRADSALRRQLLTLQQQTAQLQSQNQAQGQELGAAGSASAQQEIARAEGLTAPGEQVYAIESPLRASGPDPLEQGTSQVAQALSSLAQSLAALPPPPPRPSSPTPAAGTG